MDPQDLCNHTKIRLIAAALGHQQCTKTEACLIPLPGTERVIAIGTAERVRELLPTMADSLSANPDALARRAPAPADERATIDQFAGLPVFGMAKVAIGHPGHLVGEFIRLSDARIALEYQLSHQAAPAQGTAKRLRDLAAGEIIGEIPAFEYTLAADRIQELEGLVQQMMAAPASNNQVDSALEIECLLAKYHSEVWEVAQSDTPDYDYAGRETAKELVRAIHRIAAPAQPSAATFKHKIRSWCGNEIHLSSLVESLNTYSRVMPTAGRAQWAMREAAKYIEACTAAAAPTSDQQAGAATWTAEEIADACVKAGLGILECNSLIVTLKGAAPAAIEQAGAQLVADQHGAAMAPADVEKMLGRLCARLKAMLGDEFHNVEAMLRHVHASLAALVTPAVNPAKIDSFTMADGFLVKREVRADGSHCWLMYDETGRLIRACSPSECDFINAALAAPTPAADQSQAARDVLAERRRQVEQEGWTPGHDDAYKHGELSRAAACYAVHDTFSVGSWKAWAWPDVWWKPAGERGDLVKAGALILAEIERIDRAAARAADQVDSEGGHHD